jgi:hypothetical protein
MKKMKFPAGIPCACKTWHQHICDANNSPYSTFKLVEALDSYLDNETRAQIIISLVPYSVLVLRE